MNRFSTPLVRTANAVGFSAPVMAAVMISSAPAIPSEIHAILRDYLLLRETGGVGSSEIDVDKYIGMGYVYPNSPLPQGDDWSSVAFTGRNGIKGAQDLPAAIHDLEMELIDQAWEAVQPELNGIDIENAEFVIPVLLADKGLSWVQQALSEGDLLRKAHELSPIARRLVEGESVNEIAKIVTAIDGVDIAALGEYFPRDESGLPISYDRMAGMGIIDDLSGKMPSPENYGTVTVKVDGVEYTLLDVTENEHLSESIRNQYLRIVQDELRMNFTGDPENAEGAVMLAGLFGIGGADLIATKSGQEMFRAIMSTPPRQDMRPTGMDF